LFTYITLKLTVKQSSRTDQVVNNQGMNL